MARAKSKKKETYYQRWLKGKKRMLLIMKEEEFNAIKAFCDEHKMPYREFFTQVAPKLLIENQKLTGEIEDLRKALAERESQLSTAVNENQQLRAQLNDLQAKLKALRGDYNRLYSEYTTLSDAYSKLKSEKEALERELANTRAELSNAKQSIEELRAQLRSKEDELSKLKDVLETITGRGKVELPAELCSKLEKFGFHLVQKGVGFKKKVVCTNSEELV